MYAKLVAAALAIVGAFAIGGIALLRDEPINSLWIVTAAICVYVLGYRFYAKWIETRVFVADKTRATPAERLNNGRDFIIDSYVSHTGDRPMRIVWKLDHELPADIFHSARVATG